ncbi:MAG TPA: regulatory protein GemA [Candidatus Binataceae bacterium]|nr:regulatory protein GemA [Candidatus Binataceae bacterium]
MTPEDPNRRKGELAVIHLAKKELRLDDWTYRKVVARVSARFRREAVDSAGLLNTRERAALIEELHGLGFHRAVNRPARAPAPGSFQETKIIEIWRLLDQAGALRDSSDKALHAFVRRQTAGAQSIPRWLTAEQANKVIEGLKAWLKRG